MRHTLTAGVQVEITTVAERPEPSRYHFDAGPWGEFMRFNRVAEAYFLQARQVFPEICLLATTDDGTVVADGQAVPLALGGPGRARLPDGGWEQAVVWAFADQRRGVQPNAACALNIAVAASLQGQGLSRLILAALRDAVRDAGLSTLVAPVRPTWKDREPWTTMGEYAARVRTDGMPYDPWLRTHVRAGGVIVAVAPTSWVIAATLADWRAWTGLAFDADGEVEVPYALVPVRCDTRAGHVTYVEPNVWVRHDVGSSRPLLAAGDSERQ
ncbi:N-acetyltransferase [Actinopolymorpha pittospori]|uniref:GNAT superfamily N-acetyltransferase n=1 Tax=Actinopolymorpha pittospori TaxID=648752 RepID=A0A927N650_9ACTN|nr:N-acetyltransferase [Actinopolymorpha pittospori]MBE1609672.1 GNAT superfamily N-acetyltransferase [Actinopolymorpha pittospori]